MPKAVRRFMVQAFACYQTPTEVLEAVKERFDLEISKQKAAYYDADHSPDLAAEWVAVFRETRKAFLSETAKAAIAHQSFRLQELMALYRKAKTSKNTPLAASLLEQAAKECGGAFTNARSLSGSLAVTIDDLLRDMGDAGSE